MQKQEPLGYVLKRAQASLRLVMDEALHGHGLSMAQYALLSSLEGEPVLTNAELARRAFVTPQTTIRIVADLQRAGLVERTPDTKNRRRLNVSLTSHGRSRVRSAKATVLDVETRMIEGLTEEEVDHLRMLLEHIATNLASPE